jgi:hypothetical protein
VIITVCVELAGKSMRVMVDAVPTVPDVAVILGEPAGALVDREPVSSGELPLRFIAVIAKLCQVDGVRPVAVYDGTFPTAIEAPPSTLTQYVVMPAPPL